MRKGRFLAFIEFLYGLVHEAVELCGYQVEVPFGNIPQLEVVVCGKILVQIDIVAVVQCIQCDVLLVVQREYTHNATFKCSTVVKFQSEDFILCI